LRRTPEQQKREAKMIRDSGKTAIYNFPLLAALPGCDPNATENATIMRTRDAVLPHLDAAVDTAAPLNNIASGVYPRPRNVSAPGGLA